MLNGLDLFSGIGGLAISLKKWVRPIAYCELDPYCQSVLLNQMELQTIPSAPIWDDIRTLCPFQFSEDCIDIIFGGFPCQDISVAGRGKGLEGERSGLFFEIVRLAKEIKPKFIFLENVPAITIRGGITVVRTLAEMGYDCRWCVISAASVGAPHLRERWFLLAYAKHFRSSRLQERGSTEKSFSDAQEGKNLSEQSKGMDQSEYVAECPSSNSSSVRFDERSGEGIRSEGESIEYEKSCDDSDKVLNFWEEIESPVCGVDDAIPHRAHRIKALGNAVVPCQAEKAFKILMGLQ